MSFLLEGSVKVERESVRVEVVAEYFNISTFYVLSYLQPNKTIFRVLIGFIREFFLTAFIQYVLCYVLKPHKKEKQNFQQLSTENLFSKLSKFDIY